MFTGITKHLQYKKSESKSPLTERMRMWQDSKDKKIIKTREEKEKKELTECTFKPQIVMVTKFY